MYYFSLQISFNVGFFAETVEFSRVQVYHKKILNAPGNVKNVDESIIFCCFFVLWKCVKRY